MWYTAKQWMQSGNMFISPTLDDYKMGKLSQQLTTRKKKLITGKEAVESKDDWKARNKGKSPDEADATIQLTQLVKILGTLPSRLSDDAVQQYTNNKWVKEEEEEYYDFSEI
jgi:hypothetical protein